MGGLGDFWIELNKSCDIVMGIFAERQAKLDAESHTIPLPGALAALPRRANAQIMQTPIRVRLAGRLWLGSRAKWRSRCCDAGCGSAGTCPLHCALPPVLIDVGKWLLTRAGRSTCGAPPATAPAPLRRRASTSAPGRQSHPTNRACCRAAAHRARGGVHA